MEEEDIFALAQTLWGEARGEDDEGMMAVCCTVINRFNSGKWYAGKTIEETCKSRGNIHVGTMMIQIRLVC